MMSAASAALNGPLVPMDGCYAIQAAALTQFVRRARQNSLSLRKRAFLLPTVCR